MGCRPSRRSTGRVGDFQHKRKNNNTYSYLKEVTDKGIVNESVQSTGHLQHPTKKDKKRETSKEFNSFSTTSKTYFKPGLRSSKITVRLSTDGSMLEIEEFEIEPPNFRKSKGTDEDVLLKTRRASAPIFKFQEGKTYSSIYPFQISSTIDKMKLKDNLIHIHRVDSLRAPLASVEGDSFSDDDDLGVTNAIITECEAYQTRNDRDKVGSSGEDDENLRIICSPNDNQIVKCHMGNTERPHRREKSYIYHSDNKCRLCLPEESLCTQIDNYCQRELSTENKIVIWDSETNAYEVLDKSLSGTLSSAFQLSADICKMKLNRNDVGSKDKAKLEEASGYTYDKEIMNVFMDHNSSVGRNSDIESLSDIQSPTWKLGNIDASQSLDELEGTTPDYSMNFPSDSVLEFKYQNGDNISDIDQNDISINCKDLHQCIVSPHMSDCEESMTYTSANSDFLCSDDEEYSLPLCPCGDDSVVYNDHKVKSAMTLHDCDHLNV